MSPSPNVNMAEKTTITRPLPGPVIVRLDPPKRATTEPPTIAEIIPAMGGAPEAIARPRPSY